jgi:hypothetical protein
LPSPRDIVELQESKNQEENTITKLAKTVLAGTMGVAALSGIGSEH